MGVDRVTMDLGGGCMCYHCGTLRIAQGTECYRISAGGQEYFVHLDHADVHQATTGWQNTIASGTILGTATGVPPVPPDASGAP